MTEAAEGTRLWEPSEEFKENANITRYMEWLEREKGLSFDDYGELWEWSANELEEFWASVWEYFEVQASRPYERVLGSHAMPGTEWFEGAELNYAEHVFRNAGERLDEPAVLQQSELRPLSEVTWRELQEQVGSPAAGLKDLGVQRGDRVVAYVPNVPEAIVAFLACASLGAIWSSCSPDFGVGSVVDRFTQIEPKVLFAVDGYRYGGKDHDRIDVVARLQEEIPTLEKTVVLPYLNEEPETGGLENVVLWDDLLSGHEGAELEFEQVPFDHPLWVLYSSGTTGLPKAIVQGQGGILLEHLKKLHLHVNAQEGDRIFWYTTTGWMMWNFLVGCLLTEASIVLYDGSPGHPDMGVLWDLAESAQITTFGTSASYIASCMKAGVEPGDGRDLSKLTAVGSTGSPLSPEGFRWVYEHVGADTWLFSTSGGTDLCTAFVGGTPLEPVYEGELQARALGAAIESWDPAGKPQIGEVGELVLTEPMPSMPIYFWGDEDGSRYRDAYFDTYPGVWRHGDWIEITDRGTAIISGRSDATINRGGIRMGTAEIYRAVLALDEIVDALVVDVEEPGRDAWMPLFVVLAEGAELDDELV